MEANMGLTAQPHSVRAGNPAYGPVETAEDLFLSERRRSSRKSLIGGRLVTVRLGTEASGLALDLSETGMGLRAFPELKVGSTTTLLFELPQQQARIEAQALVAWVERTGSLWSKGSGGRTGLHFTDLSPENREILARWLAQDSPAPKPVPAAPEPASEGHRQDTTTAPAHTPGDPLVAMRAHLRQAQLSGIAALQWIMEQVLTSTGARGAAVALQDGQGMICCAAAGNAPDLGVRVQGESGLSGHCVRTGEMVLCDDTEEDPRVDRDLCRELNLRCALILPLFRGRQLCGVLEVFSDRPRAFDPLCASLLKRISNLVVEVAVHVLPELASPAPASANGPSSPSAPPAGDARRDRSLAAGTTAAPLSRRSLRTASLSHTLVCDVCGHSNPRGKRVCSHCDVPLSVVENFLGTPTTEEIRAAEAATLIAENRLPVTATPAATYPLPVELQTGNRKPWIAVAVGCALLSLALGLWKGRQVGPSASAAAAPETSVSRQPALEPVLPPPAQPALVPSPAARREPPPAEPVRAAPRPSSSRQASSEEEDDEGSVKWVIPGGLKSLPTRKATATVLPPAGAPPVPQLPQVAAVSELLKIGVGVAPSAPISKGVTGGRLIQKVDPVYPPAARMMGRAGSVVISAVVNREGRLQSTRVLSGDSLLAKAALEAAGQWRYEPYRLNGNPVESQVTITFTFKL
jgi:TonB family protein